MNKAFKIEVSPSQESNPENVPKPEPPSWTEALRERAKNLKKDHSPVLEDQEIPMTEVEDEEGNKKEIGVYRFSDEEDEETLLNEFVDRVVKDAEWYKISYHICDHDEEKRGGCGKWIVKEEVKK